MPDRFGSGKHRTWRRALFVAACVTVSWPARANECAPEPQSEGRIAQVIDARTLRLDDGRIVRLSGLAPLRGVQADRAATLLATLAVGRTVSLHGETDAPDRYGRQEVWAFAEGEAVSVQAMLVASGGGVRDVGVTPAGCRASLDAAEQAARTDRLGLWAAPKNTKNAESPDDISAEIGHFAVIEGRVRSVRTSGGTTYLNFGRRWTEGFAVMVPGRATAAFEAAGRPLKGFEGKQVRVRGYVVRRGGPRIEALDVEQIEAIGGGAVTTAGTRD